MKKIRNKYAYGAAVLLAGAMAFTSCSSDDEVVNVNPSFDGESVKTQFAINIPRAAQNQTRMTGDNTQSGTDAKFLGMQDIRLYPFALASGTKPTTIPSVITLPNLTNEIHGTTPNDRSSKIYNDVTIPVGTNHFLFYGQAVRTYATYFANGFLTTTFDGATNVDNITFALKDVLGVNDVPSDNDQTKALLAVLNSVAKVDNGWSTSTDKSLKKLYNDFVKMEAGSASSIKAALESLYNAASKLKTTDNDIPDKIMKAIVATYEGTQVFTASTTDDITTLSYYKTNENEMFPRNLNMPDGSVVVKFDTEDNKNEFIYSTSQYVIGSGNNTINVANVTYPASLYYCANTTLKASDNSVTNWPTTTTEWSNGFTDWGETVLASTRSIAMTDNINYGVGNLALSVKTGAQTLTDRKKTENGNESQNNITVGENTFPITAILIGGQPAKIGYDFTPASDATYPKTIYDKIEAAKYATYVNGDAEVCNYTLVLPNKQEEPAEVQFAIELENKSDVEFVGHNGQIIYRGSKFYLIGKLNPTTTGNAAQGSTSEAQNVFESDYMTTAKVTITSLENAYNVIPDLRATNLEFGLSVDLEWKNGIVFDVEVGKD